MSLEELKELEARYAMPTYARAPVEFVRGEGARLWDADGREYLDFFSGLSVHNAGHCHPLITAAIQQQAERLVGTSNLYYTEQVMRLYRRLSASSLGGRVFLANSGTEANEAAIKVARKRAHLRGVDLPEIVTVSDAFHGRSLAPLAATPKLAREDLFGPLPKGFISVPRDDPEALRAAVSDQTAAVMLEPIQGEAGVFPISDEVLLAAREACSDSGALLIFDEVQTGMGRTGSLWAYEQTPVRPDVMTSAKALGGGLPVGACVLDRAVDPGLELGEHGSTFAGAPVAAAAALAAFEVLDDPDLLRGVRELGAKLRDGLTSLDAVTEVRGRGLMVGLSLADGIEAAAVGRRALEAGLVINVPGTGMLRLLPPLVLSGEEVTRGLEILAGALRGP